MSEALQPVFAIEKIYLKDLSVEAPNTPEIFSEREAPTVEVDIHSEAREVQPALFEVVLKVTITAKAKEKAIDRKSTRLNSSHTDISRMPSSA